MPQDISDDESTVVEVMARQHQAITWDIIDPDLDRHMAITMPLWVNVLNCFRDRKIYFSNLSDS